MPLDGELSPYTPGTFTFGMWQKEGMRQWSKEVEGKGKEKWNDLSICGFRCRTARKKVIDDWEGGRGREKKGGRKNMKEWCRDKETRVKESRGMSTYGLKKLAGVAMCLLHNGNFKGICFVNCGSWSGKGTITKAWCSSPWHQLGIVRCVFLHLLITLWTLFHFADG